MLSYMSELRAERIVFPNNNSALYVRAPEDADAQSIIAALEIPAPRALLILNGGTAALDARISEYLQELFTAVARTVIENGITVVTGATNAGIFAVFGRALEKAGRLNAPCIGVTSGGQAGLADLEPHHSYFVLVETEDWSGATPLMYSMIAALAGDCPSLAIFASGGEITLDEMQANVEQNREMVLIAGSLGYSDTVVAAYLGEPTTEEAVKRIATRGRLKTFTIEQPPAVLSNLIHSRLLSV
jgi:hypothetical protein